MLKYLILLFSSSLFAFNAHQVGKTHGELMVDGMIKVCKAIKHPQKDQVWQPSTADYARLAFLKGQLFLAKKTVKQCATLEQRSSFLEGFLETLIQTNIHQKAHDAQLDPLGTIILTGIAFPSLIKMVQELSKPEHQALLCKLFTLYAEKELTI